MGLLQVALGSASVGASVGMFGGVMNREEGESRFSAARSGGMKGMLYGAGLGAATVGATMGMGALAKKARPAAYGRFAKMKANQGINAIKSTLKF